MKTKAAVTMAAFDKKEAARKRKALKALKLVAEVYNDGGRAGTQFTALLSAIRGPDQHPGTVDADMLKRSTTAVIRSRLGFEMGRGLVINEYSSLPAKTDFAEILVEGGLHFGEHIRSAIDALRYFGLTKKGD